MLSASNNDITYMHTFPCIMHKFDGNKRKFLFKYMLKQYKSGYFNKLFQTYDVFKSAFSHPKIVLSRNSMEIKLFSVPFVDQ